MVTTTPPFLSFPLRFGSLLGLVNDPKNGGFDADRSVTAPIDRCRSKHSSPYCSACFTASTATSERLHAP